MTCLQRNDGPMSTSHGACELVLLDPCDRSSGDRVDKPSGHAVTDKSSSVVVGDSHVHLFKQVQFRLGLLHEPRRLEHVQGSDHVFREPRIQDECLPRPFGRFARRALRIRDAFD